MFLLIRPSLLCLLLAVVVAVPAPKNASDLTLAGLSRHLDIPSAAKHAKLSLPFSKSAYVAGRPQAIFGGAKELRRSLSSSVLKKQRGKILSKIQTASRNKILLNRQVFNKLKLSFFPSSGRLAKNYSPASATFFLKTLIAKRKALNPQPLHQINRGKRDIMQELERSETVTSPHSLKWKNLLDMSRAASERDGITGESCSSDSDCLGERRCVDPAVDDGADDSCSGGTSCFCLIISPCASSSDCETTGEVCAILSSGSICVAESFAQQANLTIVDDGSPGNSTGAGPGGDVSEDGGDTALTGESCSSDSDCLGERQCIDLEEEDRCSGGGTCFCVPNPLEVCTSSSDCETTGEVCVFISNSSVCFSESAAEEGDFTIVDEESPTDGDGTGDDSEDGEGNGEGTQNEDGIDTNEDEEACIDARALDSVSSEDLVFKKHAIGRVLCDEYGSCATSGHMVTFHGRAMRMRTYCDEVGCQAATMAVNSARYNRGLRIRSKTEGMEYTAFAARYDTRAEEMVIRMAVGLGL